MAALIVAGLEFNHRRHPVLPGDYRAELRCQL
jgi:hypothetical protein